jgi:ACS family allantoate permease-like MFS transporter
MVLLTVQVGVAYLLHHINVRLNRTRQKVLGELKASRGWTDDDVWRLTWQHPSLIERYRNVFFMYTT